MTTDDLMPRVEVEQLICSKLGFSSRHVKERVMKRPDFPKPVRQVGRGALYLRQSVFKWLGLK